MLEGKSAGEKEEVTMDAIKSILSDFEHEFQAIQTPRAQTQRASQTERAADNLGLAPVTEIDTKVARARFTTVPTVDVPHAATRPVCNAQPKETPRMPSDIVALAADEQTPRKQMRLPQLAMPEGVKRLMSNTKSSKQAAAQLRSVATWPRVAMIAAATFVVLWPGLAVMLVLLSVFAVVGLFLLIGAETIWAGLGKYAAWQSKRHPEKKDAIYDKLDEIALRWDNLLDRFPDGMVDGLYMPDFANVDEKERVHEAIVADRLNRMQQQA